MHAVPVALSLAPGAGARGIAPRFKRHRIVVRGDQDAPLGEARARQLGDNIIEGTLAPIGMDVVEDVEPRAEARELRGDPVTRGVDAMTLAGRFARHTGETRTERH